MKNQTDAARDKSQILPDFLECFRNKDDSRAWEIASQTKELVTGAMLAPQMAQKFLEADEQSRKDEAAEILSVFAYLGELEKQNANDEFFAAIAGYYSKTNQTQRQKPAGAQIVYYAVLPDKLLIWQISDFQFTTVEKIIDADELDDKIAN